MAGCPICEDLHHGASSCPHSLVGATLGKYRVSRFLAAGGMGAVYIGEHQTLGSPVAVKTLHRALLPQNARTDDRRKLAETLVQRFTDEARRAASLRHPNIVRVEDLGVAPDGTPYLAMEFLEGMSLKELLETSGPLEPSRAIELVTQALDALEFAHQRGIIHRDIKPENLYLQHPGQSGEAIKVLDFGIAKAVGDGATQFGLTQTGHGAMGTFYYMSPEQAADPRKVTAGSDIFSAGATLFELLTGRTVLFDVERELTTSGLMAVQFLHGVLTAIIEGNIERHPARVRAEIPGWLDAAVARALAHEPEARFAGAGEMAAALRAGRPIASSPVALAATAPSPRVTLPRTQVAPALGTTTTESAGERAAPLPQPRPLVPAKGSSRPRVVIVFAVAVAAAGAAMAAVLGGGEPEITSSPPVDTGDVIASSVDAGEVIPLSVDAALSTTAPVDAGTPEASEPEKTEVASAGDRDAPKPKPKKTEPAGLRIESTPPCDAFVDGRAVGRTPVGWFEVRPGRHAVRLVNQERGIAKSFTVRVKRGEKKRVAKNLGDREPPPPSTELPESPSRGDIKKGMGQVHRRALACRQRRGLTFTGVVKVRFTVAPDGSVSAATASPSAPAGLRRCVERAVRRARFPQSQKGITVSFPFTFR